MQDVQNKSWTLSSQLESSGNVCISVDHLGNNNLVHGRYNKGIQRNGKREELDYGHVHLVVYWNPKCLVVVSYSRLLFKVR